MSNQNNQQKNQNNNNFNNFNPSPLHSSPQPISWGEIALYGVVGAAFTVGLYAFTHYQAAKANQYIVRTGLLINEIDINKQCVKWPLQQLNFIELAPKSYNFTLHAMSLEKMEFILPCVFTIGPRDQPSRQFLRNYAKYLLNQEEEKISDTIQGMIEGETRVLAANMSIEDIFKGRTEFKNKIIQEVEQELSKLGLCVFNANIKELQDSKDSKYFSYLSQKVSADAQNQAKIDISEAKKRGHIGEKEREGETRQRIVEIESKTKIYQNQRQQEIATSTSELNKKQAELYQIVKIAQIESEKNSERRNEEMQREVEVQRYQRETEKQRAEKYSIAQVQAEIVEIQAIGQANAMQKIADAELYKQNKESEALLYQKQKQAEGISAIYNAQAEGLRRIVLSFNGDVRGALNYLMIEQELFPQLAKESANAIQGLQPKINIWNTGSSDGDKNPFSSIQNLAQSIPPIIETIYDQTKIELPEWLIKLKDEKQVIPTDGLPKIENKKSGEN